MAPSEDGTLSKKRSLDVVSVSASSSSSDESARKKKRRDRKNASRKDNVAVNGAKPSAFEKRRNSLAKASRDPRDEPAPKKRPSIAGAVTTTRSPSPVIDFDGLSRPSRF